jgi:hypothetical protein
VGGNAVTNSPERQALAEKLAKEYANCEWNYADDSSQWRISNDGFLTGALSEEMAVFYEARIWETLGNHFMKEANMLLDKAKESRRKAGLGE